MQPHSQSDPSATNGIPVSVRVRFAVLFAVLWYILTEGNRESWLLGVPIVIGLAFWVPRAGEIRTAWSLMGILSLTPYFLYQSLRGGWDVAWRAWRPDMRLSLASMHYPVRLPEGLSRQLFMNCITLLPGTLSVRLEKDDLIVHLLDDKQPNRSEIQALEKRVARVFKADLSADA